MFSNLKLVKSEVVLMIIVNGENLSKSEYYAASIYTNVL